MVKCGGCVSPPKSKKYKYKPNGKMIKDIKKMTPGKKIGGDMVYPMAATLPFGKSKGKGIGNTFSNAGKKLNDFYTNNKDTINNVMNGVSTGVQLFNSLSGLFSGGNKDNNTSSKPSTSTTTTAKTSDGVGYNVKNSYNNNNNTTTKNTTKNIKNVNRTNVTNNYNYAENKAANQAKSLGYYYRGTAGMNNGGTVDGGNRGLSTKYVENARIYGESYE